MSDPSGFFLCLFLCQCDTDFLMLAAIMLDISIKILNALICFPLFLFDLEKVGCLWFVASSNKYFFLPSTKKEEKNKKKQC